MSTAISMPSPHHAGGSGAFATSLQLSPAFRSLHAAALRQRQAEIDRLKELARSDEFSDDESDGEEDEEEDEEEEQDDAVRSDDTDDEEEQEERRDVVHPPEASPRDHASSSDSDIDDTVMLPFVRPPVMHRPGQQLVSPRADDWTLVDKSPTCEGLVYGGVNVTESWFSKP